METRPLFIRRGAARGVLAAMLVIAATVVAAPAEARSTAREACGLVVTSDYTLQSNLSCSGTAITIDAEPGQVVTLDLGDHAVVGDGTGSGVYVDALSGSTDVVIRNGRIRGFDAAVAGNGVLDLTLEDLILRDHRLWVGGPAQVFALTVERTRIVDAGVAVVYTESTTTVRNSQFVRSGIDSPSQTYTNVYDSTFVGGGVRTGAASNVVAERNRFTQCDVGLAVGDSWPSSPTVIRDNVFLGCRVGVDMQVLLTGTGPNALTVAGNQFRHNTDEGLLFAKHAPIGVVFIVENRAIGNGGSGIAGSGSGVVTVADNTVVRNGGHGIDVSDVVDGGGNVARRNGQGPQCVGVTCTS